MDRLLTPKEICEFSEMSLCRHCTCLSTGKAGHIPCQIFDNTVLALKAQLAKTDREWVEWLDELIIGCTGGIGKDATVCIVLDMSLRQWQERKRELGI